MELERNERETGAEREKNGRGAGAEPERNAADAPLFAPTLLPGQPRVSAGVTPLSGAVGDASIPGAPAAPGP